MGTKKQKTAAAAASVVVKPTAKALPADDPMVDSSKSEKSDFLKLFWTLAESDRTVRTQAVAQLLMHLQQKPTDVDYTLKRLVRGLASSRAAARQGFSAALTTLLATFDSIVLTEVLELLHDAMEVHQSMKGMEQREHMFGRLFGLLALHRSGRLQDDDKLLVKVVNELLELAKWKKWIREACYEGVLAVLSSVPPMLFLSELVDVFISHLQGDVSSYNADQVLLAAGVCHYLQVSAVDDQVPASFLTSVDIIKRKQIHLLVEPLKQSSSSYPRTHSAWFGIFGHILHTGKDAAHFDGELFQEAWNVLVENMLVEKSTATHERKGLAFKLFELLVPALPRPLLRAILTPRFVKCLYNNAVTKKNYLHDAARHCIKAFATAAPEEFFHFFQKQFVKPLAALVEIGSDEDDEDENEEDREKKKKEQMSARLSSGGFDAIIAIEEEKERAEILRKKTDNVRLWALDTIVSALSELLMKDDDVAADSEATGGVTLKDQVLRFLLLHSFVKTTKSPTPSKSKKKKKTDTSTSSSDFGLEPVLMTAEPMLSSNVASNCMKRLFSLLNAKLSTDASSVLSCVFTISQELVHHANAGEFIFRHPLDEETLKELSTINNRVSEIRSRLAGESESTIKQQLEAFLLLSMSTALQLLDADQRSDAAVVAVDLTKCYGEMLADDEKKKNKSSQKKKKTTSQKNKKIEEPKSEEEHDSIVVLTDLLLSLLSQDSSAMRDIVTHVFRSILPLLNGPSIQTMVNVLLPNEEDENEENAPANRREQDDEEDEAIDEQEEEEEVVLSSAAEVSEALNKDAKLAELHREDMAIAAIVGQVKDKAKKKKDVKKMRLQVVHFQLRVLDLLQVFVTRNSASPHVLAVVVPLFQVLTSIPKSDTEKRVLSERLQSVLMNKVLRSNKDVPNVADLPEAVTSALEGLSTVTDLLMKKSLEKDQAGKVGAALVVYLVRVLCGKRVDASASLTQVQEVMKTVVLDAFTKKHSRFPRTVFDDLITRYPILAVHLLLEPLAMVATCSEKKDNAESAPVAIDEFSKCEVFRLLSLIVKPKYLSEPSEQQIFDRVNPSLNQALIQLLKNHEQLKAKRMKIVMSFALHFVKVNTEASGKDKKKIKRELKPLMDVVQTLESSSPVIKLMVKQLIDASALAVTTPAKIEKADEEEKELLPETKDKKKKKGTSPSKKKRKRSIADEE